MERAIKYFLIALILLISFTLPQAVQIDIKKPNKVLIETPKVAEEEMIENENEEEEEEEEEEVEEKISKPKPKKRAFGAPKVREEAVSKSFSLDDLIDLAKKHKNPIQPSQAPVKKMRYVEEKAPILPPATSIYQPKKGVHRKHFMPIDRLPQDQYSFAIQIICSPSFIKAFSALLSGQKDLTYIEFKKQDSGSHEKVVTVCQHLNLGNSIKFIYLPENSQNKIFGLHLSHLIKNMASNKKIYGKRGLSKHVSSSKWTYTLATLSPHKKVVRYCTQSRNHGAHLSSKIEKNIYQAINKQPQSPLEGIRDLFDHGNGICSVKQIKLMIAHQDKNLIR